MCMIWKQIDCWYNERLRPLAGLFSFLPFLLFPSDKGEKNHDTEKRICRKDDRR